MHRDSERAPVPAGDAREYGPRRRAIAVAVFFWAALLGIVGGGCGGGGQGSEAGESPAGVSGAGPREAGEPQAPAERRSLTTDPAADRAPRFSPDGRWLAFESDRGDTWSLWLLDLEDPDAAPVALTDDAGDDRSPAWAPDGRQIVFQSDREGRAGLWVLELGAGPAAAAPPRLLLADTTREMLPDWAPDGARIVFNSTRGGSDGDDPMDRDPDHPAWLDLWIVPVAGGEPERLTDAPWRDLGPRFSPDGARVAFQSRRNTDGDDDEIYVLDIGTGQTTRITNRPGHDFVPAWSPDGTRLAVATMTGSGDTVTRAITIYDLAGTPLARLGEGYDRVTLPDWSPDGTRIAYAARLADSSYDIWIEPAPR